MTVTDCRFSRVDCGPVMRLMNLPSVEARSRRSTDFFELPEFVVVDKPPQ
jgi:hypothetical protein